MLWRQYTETGKRLEVFKVMPPSSKNPVELLLMLQDAMTQGEAVLQNSNIIIVKLRALLYAVVPQATVKVAMGLILVAVAFTLLPLKYLVLMGFLETYTREMPLRKQLSDRWVRRVREWWIRIPATPVQVMLPDHNNNKMKKK